MNSAEYELHRAPVQVPGLCSSLRPVSRSCLAVLLGIDALLPGGVDRGEIAFDLLRLFT